MEQPEAQQPTADASDAGQATPPEGSGSAPEPSPNDVMNDVIRQAAASRSASNLGGVAPTADMANAPEAESAPPPGDVRADGSQSGTGQSPTPGRRASKAEANQARIDELAAENARLAAALAEANPPPPDASEEARARYVEDEQRYRRLRDKPDTDTDWNQADYDWLQREKELRKITPELTARYEANLDAIAKSHADDADTRVNGFLDFFQADMNSVMDLPGMTDEAKAALRAERVTPFSAHIYAHRKAERQLAEAEYRDEIARLRSEVGELKRSAIAGVPPIPTGGRSGGPTAPQFDMNSLIRQAAAGRIG